MTGETAVENEKKDELPIDKTKTTLHQILAIYTVVFLVLLTVLVILTYFKAPISILEMGDKNIQILIYTASAGGIGGAVYNMRTFSSNTENIEKWFIWYLLFPLGSIFFGVFSYVLVAGGVLVLSAGGSDTGTTINNTIFFYCGLAFLAGFATEQFIKQLTELANVIFQPAEKKK